MNDREMITCPKCSGDGEVKLPEAIGSPRTPQYVPCRMCNGSGKIPNERR